jgi:LBP / BPI / CETP family, N-terminal domain
MAASDADAASVAVLRDLLGGGGAVPNDDAIAAALRDAGGDVELAAAVLLSSAVADEAGVSDNIVEVSGSGSKEESDEAMARRLAAEEERDALGLGMGGFGGDLDADERLARELERQEMQQRIGGMGAAGSGAESPGVDASALAGMFALGGSEMLKPFLAELRETLLPELRKSLEEADLPEIDEHLEEQKLDIKLGNLKIVDLTLPPEDLDLAFDAARGGFVLTMANLGAKLDKFVWGFKKHSFPKVGGKGTGKVEVKATSVSALVSLPSFAASEVTVTVGDLSIKLKGGLASPVYNLVISIFKSTIKTQLERALEDVVRSTIQSASGDIMDTMQG